MTSHPILNIVKTADLQAHNALRCVFFFSCITKQIYELTVRHTATCCELVDQQFFQQRFSPQKTEKTLV